MRVKKSSMGRWANAPTVARAPAGHALSSASPLRARDLQPRGAVATGDSRSRVGSLGRPKRVEGESCEAIGRELDLDRSAAGRRCRAAIEAGCLTNVEDKKGKPARIVLRRAASLEPRRAAHARGSGAALGRCRARGRASPREMAR